MPEPPAREPDPEPPRRGIATPVMVVACAAMLAAIGLLLTMPGGSDSTSTALSPIAQAAQRTASVPGARFSGTGTGSFPDGSMTMSFNGVYNGATDQSSMTMNAQVSGSASGSFSMTMVQDGLVSYMSSPLFEGQLPDGATWMKIDMSQFTGDLPPESSTGAVDASQMLESLSAVSGDARVVGTQRIRGVKATQYSATIDPALQAQALRDQGLDTIADAVELQPPSAVSVWLDKKGMVRRMAMDMPVGLPGEAPARMSMSFDFYDFGIRPEITVPPEDAAFDATELGVQALAAES